MDEDMKKNWLWWKIIEFRSGNTFGNDTVTKATHYGTKTRYIDGQIAKYEVLLANP